MNKKFLKTEFDQVVKIPNQLIDYDEIVDDLINLNIDEYNVKEFENFLFAIIHYRLGTKFVASFDYNEDYDEFLITNCWDDQRNNYYDNLASIVRLIDLEMKNKKTNILCLSANSQLANHKINNTYGGELLAIRNSINNSSIIVSAKKWQSEEIKCIQRLLGVFNIKLRRMQMAEKLEHAQKNGFKNETNSDQEIDVLVKGLAHNFNTPLTIAIGNIDLALMYLKKNSDQNLQEVTKSMQITRRELLKIAKMVSSLVEHNQDNVESDKHISLEDWKSFITNVCNQDKYKNRLLFCLPTVCCQIKGNLQNIQDSLIKVIDNALESYDNGNQKVKISFADSIIQKNKTKSRYFKISILDNGCGMDKKTRKLMFVPYFTTKGYKTDLGFSLYSVHKIIQKNGGYITVKSKLKKGTLVNIYLPAVE